MLAIFLIVLADLMGFGVIIPLLPFYARKYAASDFQVGLLFTIFSLCQMLATPVLGLMSDRFGRRPVLLLSQIGSVLGYLLLTYATYRQWNNVALGLMLVYASRAIDGLSGGNIATAQAYISDITTPQTRAKGMGMLGAAFGIGFSIGPAVGGLLGSLHMWLPALLAAAMSGGAALQTYFRLPESRFHRPSEAGMWLHPSRFAPIVLNTAVMQLLLISFLSMLAFVMMETVFPLFLNDVFGYGPRQVGWFFGLAGLVIIVVQGGLIRRLTHGGRGEWTLAILGPVLVSIAMAWYAGVTWWHSVPLVILGTLCNATGRSLQTPTLSSLISKFAPAEQQGATFGLYHMLGSLARVLGPMIATWQLVYTRHHAAPFAIAGAITAAVATWTVVLRVEARGHDPTTAATAAMRPSEVVDPAPDVA
jgi:DHA1 family tetracycline resistance protein-like MFS transporter